MAGNPRLRNPEIGSNFKLRPPTPRQARLLNNLVAGQAPFEASRNAGYGLGRVKGDQSANTGRNITRALNTTAGALVKAELEKIGVDPEYLAKSIKDGIEGQRTVRKGWQEWGPEADYLNRHKYITMAVMLCGHQPPLTVQHEHHAEIEHNVRHMLVSAYSLMARSTGLEITEAQIESEVDLLSQNGQFEHLLPHLQAQEEPIPDAEPKPHPDQPTDADYDDAGGPPIDVPDDDEVGSPETPEVEPDEEPEVYTDEPDPLEEGAYAQTPPLPLRGEPKHTRKYTHKNKAQAPQVVKPQPRSAPRRSFGGFEVVIANPD